MLKLWSGHGPGGETVHAAEEVERQVAIKAVRDLLKSLEM